MMFAYDIRIDRFGGVTKFLAISFGDHIACLNAMFEDRPRFQYHETSQ